MKRILTILAVITASLVVLDANAGSNSTKFYQKIPVEFVNPTTTGNALETHYGELISLREIAMRPAGNQIGSVLSRNEIELTSGHVLYPEEIKFVLQSHSVGAGGGRIPGLLRAPHTPD